MDAKLLVTEPREAVFTADTHSDTWGRTLTGRSAKCTPWMKVGVPIAVEDYHKTIRATAAMDVVFPLAFPSLGEWRYGNWRNHIERGIEFIVVSPEEYRVMGDLRTSNVYARAIAIVTGLLAGIAIAAGGGRLGIWSSVWPRGGIPGH